MTDLPAQLEESFWREVTAYEEKNKMPYLFPAEQSAREKGLVQGLLTGIEVALDIKFGNDGLKLLPEIREVTDVEKLKAIQQAIKTAEKPEDLRSFWS